MIVRCCIFYKKLQFETYHLILLKDKGDCVEHCDNKRFEFDFLRNPDLQLSGNLECSDCKQPGRTLNLSENGFNCTVNNELLRICYGPGNPQWEAFMKESVILLFSVYNLNSISK